MLIYVGASFIQKYSLSTSYIHTVLNHANFNTNDFVKPRFSRTILRPLPALILLDPGAKISLGQLFLPKGRFYSIFTPKLIIKLSFGTMFGLGQTYGQY